MTVGRAIAAIVVCVVAGWLLGGGVGAMVGWLSPELLLSAVRLEEVQSSVGLGLSLGLINGTWAGVCLGAVVTAAVALYEAKKSPKTALPPGPGA